MGAWRDVLEAVHSLEKDRVRTVAEAMGSPGVCRTCGWICREPSVFLGWPEGEQCLPCWTRAKYAGERAKRLLPCPYKRRG